MSEVSDLTTTTQVALKEASGGRLALLRDRFPRLAGQRLVLANTFWALVALVGRVALQTVAFVLLARHLGPMNFGLFSAFLALASTLAPYVDLGTHGVVVRRVAQGSALATAIGESLSLTAVAAPIGIAVFAAISRLMFGSQEFLSGIVIAIGILVGTKAFNIARAAFVANEQLWRNAVVEMVGSAMQLGVVCLVIAVHGSFRLWSAGFSAAQIVTGLIGMAWVARLWGAPAWSFRGLHRRVGEGFHFAIAGAAQSAMVGIDKVLLPMLTTLAVAGVYSAANRVAVFAAVPAMALQSAIYPKYFRAGASDGIRGSRRVAVKALPVYMAYCVAVVLAAWLGAPLLPILFGPSYAGASSLLPILVVGTAMNILSIVFLDGMSAGNRLRARSIAQVGSLVLMAALMLVTVPMFGAIGAAYSVIGANLALLVVAIVECMRR